jgi:hypothetical protein
MDTMVNEESVGVTEPGPSPASGPAAWAVMLTGLVPYNPLQPNGHDKGGVAQWVVQIWAIIAPF